jgi:putative FmdB family regulatory protein
MALYDYICDDCGNQFEVFSPGFIREEQKVCPTCGSLTVRQKFSSFMSSSGGGFGGGCSAPAGSGFS